MALSKQKEPTVSKNHEEFTKNRKFFLVDDILEEGMSVDHGFTGLGI